MNKCPAKGLPKSKHAVNDANTISLTIIAPAIYNTPSNTNAYLDTKRFPNKLN
jgi:hypothetical protein